MIIEITNVILLGNYIAEEIEYVEAEEIELPSTLESESVE